MLLEFFFDLGRPLQETRSSAVDLSFDVELVAFNSKGSPVSLGEDESLRCHVLFNLFDGDVNV